MKTYSTDYNSKGFMFQNMPFHEGGTIKLFEYTIVELLECYSDATGINLIYLDNNQMVHPGSTSRRTMEELRQLDFQEVIDRLAIIKDKQKESGFYFETFFTENHFTYNLHILRDESFGQVYLVSEPMVVQPISEQSLQRISSQPQFGSVDVNTRLQNLKKIPIVSWRRIYQLGMILNRMCHSAFNLQPGQPATDAVAFGHSSARVNGMLQYASPASLSNPIALDDTTFIKLRDIVKNGNIVALPEYDTYIHIGSVNTPCFMMDDCLRIAKDYFILFSSMHLYSAVEAGLSFSEMMALSERLIGEAEQMKQPQDVYAHMQVALSAFTHAVHEYMSRQYSRPVNAFIGFIRNHFTERITLELVAEHVGLNPSYLSNLVMKETGMSLADHINRTRIEASKYELLHSNRPVHEIAQRVGYAYQSHYARLFRRFVGMTPVEFRDSKGST